MPTYAIVIDSHGNGIGSHKWMDSSIMVLASNEVECTEAQAKNPSMWQVINGVLVESISVARSTQIVLLTASANASAYAPVVYSGNTFPADEAAHARLNRLIARLQNGWVPPSGSGLPTVAGVLVTFTETEAQALANLMATQEANAFMKLSGLVAQVKNATTVSGIQEVIW